MITIREYDNTKSPVGAYANFTVLVPGYRDTSIEPSPFGDDYAIELTSQEEFNKKIGQVRASDVDIDATPCSLVELSTTPKTGTSGYPRTLPAGKTFYQRAADPVEADIGHGRYLVDDAGYHYTAFVSDGIGQVTASDFIYVLSEDDDPDYTYSSTIDWDTVTTGQYAEDAGGYGNQFAYELLGLGYTVLYADLAKLLTDYEEASLFTVFKDKAAYDFRYILTGCMDSTYNQQAIALANIRQDCTALCDIDYRIYTANNLKTIEEKVNAIETAAAATMSGKVGKYTALFANRPTYNINYPADSAYAGSKTFPGSFHYLACAAKAAENFAEWYAVGGYTRGVSNYSIDRLDINLGDAAVEALQPRNGFGYADGIICVNLMIKIKNQYLLWGNNTAEKLVAGATKDEDTLKASHFLNIRQLCTTIKKQVYVACRRLTFDPNSGILWSNFKGMVEPTLDRAKADQGCDDYLMTKVNNGRKAMMTANIRIVPIEAVKDFDISLFLEDSISGIVIGEDESAD